MFKRGIALLFLFGGLMSGPAFSSAPSPDEIARARDRQREDTERRAAAAPWRAALLAALSPSRPDRAALADVLFRITYKHFAPARHAGAPLRAWAEDIARAPFRLHEDRRSLGPNVSLTDQLEAVYALTNSDWKPPLAPVGRGTDRVSTGDDIVKWMDALTRSARRGLGLGRAPKSTWEDLALSDVVHTPEDLDRQGLPVPPPPAY